MGIRKEDCPCRTCPGGDCNDFQLVTYVAQQQVVFQMIMKRRKNNESNRFL